MTRLPYSTCIELHNKFTELTIEGLSDFDALKQIADEYGMTVTQVNKARKSIKPQKPKRERRLPKYTDFNGKITRQMCDGLWAKVVKRVGKCEKEGCNGKPLQAHHIIPRTNYALRWDVVNGVCLCLRCHLFWAHKDAVAFAEWIKTKRDIAYLESKRYNRAKLDYQAIYLHLQNELKK